MEVLDINEIWVKCESEGVTFVEFAASDADWSFEKISVYVLWTRSNSDLRALCKSVKAFNVPTYMRLFHKFIIYIY